ncbi:MAG: hypothetical protein ABI763_13115, partial [Bacteroidota bacterium]
NTDSEKGRNIKSKEGREDTMKRFLFENPYSVASQASDKQYSIPFVIAIPKVDTWMVFQKMGKRGKKATFES